VGERPGQDSGHGFDWGWYVDWLTESVGSLAAVADKLCAARGYKDDVGSTERALRRLRKRGTLDGGTWGVRALTVFGLPGAIEQRVRWLAQYHTRFADLPVSMSLEMIRALDRPPITESRSGRAWLAIAVASISLRQARHGAAIARLDYARHDLAGASAAAQAEALLQRAYVASREDPAGVPALIASAAPLVEAVPDASDRSCLQARVTDHRAYELNRAGDHAAAEAQYRALAELGAPAFTRARRAGGIAYARWRLGEADAASFATAAIEHAGDGGHVRARAMALRLYARITGDRDAEARALAIAAYLEDETLLARFGHHQG
jgi:hypothetical protein